MEQKIKDVLCSSSCPLTAPEIAKEIGCAKKEVNQVIYHINGVEKVPDTQPPKWRLIGESSGTTEKGDTFLEQDSTVSTVMTSTSPSVKKVGETSMSPGISKSDPLTKDLKQCNDDELCSLILDILKKQNDSTPLSAPEISRKLSGKITCITADCKRALHRLQIEGKVENKSPPNTKPLWVLKGSGATALSDSDLAMYNGKPLFTYEETEDEHRYKKVPRSEILRTSSEKKSENISSDQNDTIGDQIQSNIEQIDTGGDCVQSNIDTSNDQVDTSRDQVETSIDDTDTKHENKLSRDDVVTMISRSTGTETQSNTTIPMTGETDLSSQNSPQCGDRKQHSKPCKRKPQIAANFSVSFSDERSSLNERILELLQNNKEQEFTAKQVSRELDLTTRDEVLYQLENLVETGIVEKLNNQAFKYKE